MSKSIALRLMLCVLALSNASLFSVFGPFPPRMHAPLPHEIEKEAPVEHSPSIVNYEPRVVDYRPAVEHMNPTGYTVWSTHYLSAVQQAQRENKALLLLFTGTGWCKYCNMLEKEVFSQPEFSRLSSHLVFVKIEHPIPQAHLSPEEAQQNRELERQYGVKEYPTVIVVDAQGQILGRAGYEAGGPMRFNQTILNMLSTRS